MPKGFKWPKAQLCLDGAWPARGQMPRDDELSVEAEEEEDAGADEDADVGIHVPLLLWPAMEQ